MLLLDIEEVEGRKGRQLRWIGHVGDSLFIAIRREGGSTEQGGGGGS